MTETAPIDDSTGKRIAKGCFLVLLFMTILIAGSCWLIVKNKDSVVSGISSGMKDLFELPYYGESEYILMHYADLLDSLETAATNSHSLFQFAAEIENLTLPDEIIYVAIEKGDEETPVIRKLEWSGQSTMVVGNFGAGSFNSSNEKVQFSIYQSSGSWDYMDRYIVYIRHSSGLAVPDSSDQNF